MEEFYMSFWIYKITYCPALGSLFRPNQRSIDHQFFCRQTRNRVRHRLGQKYFWIFFCGIFFWNFLESFFFWFFPAFFCENAEHSEASNVCIKLCEDVFQNLQISCWIVRFISQHSALVVVQQMGIFEHQVFKVVRVVVSLYYALVIQLYQQRPKKIKN